MRSALAALLLGLFASAAAAEPKTVIGMMADTPANFDVVMRLSAGLDHQSGLRILPIAGKGPLQTLNDLVHLKGIDAALLPADVLAYAQNNGLIDVAPEKLSFLVKLGSLDVHVLARKDVSSLEQLAGLRVAVGPATDPSYISAQVLLSAANVSVEEVPLGGANAVRAVAEGQADAAILVGEEPLAELSGLKARNLHLIPVPALGPSAEYYAPALITYDDYPNLLKKGESVETVSTAVIVAVFEWPKGSPQSDVTGALADSLFRVLQPQGEQGAGLNLSASVPGWQRALVAEQLLKKRAAQSTQSQLATTEN